MSGAWQRRHDGGMPLRLDRTRLRLDWPSRDIPRERPLIDTSQVPFRIGMAGAMPPQGRSIRHESSRACCGLQTKPD
jgi:hypothetical protein